MQGDGRMTSPSRSVAEAVSIPFEVGTRRICPIFGRTQPVHERGNEYFLASFNPS